MENVINMIEPGVFTASIDLMVFLSKITINVFVRQIDMALHWEYLQKSLKYRLDT